MSDPMYGKIIIGGKLKKKLVPELIEAIKENVWNEFSGEDIKSMVEACKQNPEAIEFYEPQAKYGWFEELENFCQEHGLTFYRFSGGGYECPPEVCSWDGDKKEEYYTTCDTNEHPVLDRDDVYQFIVPIEELVKDPTKIPLYINERYSDPEWRKQVVAKYLSKHPSTDATRVLKAVINERYQQPVEVPPLEIS